MIGKGLPSDSPKFGTMRVFHPLCLLLLLSACTPSTNEKQDPAAGDEQVVNERSQWTGYYGGTLPCADCSGVTTQLWVRSDSTFVLRRRYLDRDTLAFGTVGNWAVANGHLELYDQLHVVRRLQPTAKGLLWLDEDGAPIVSNADHTLARSGGEVADEIPRMRLSGSFTYYADALSFRPCAMARNWPSAGGREWTDEGEVLGSMGTAELQERYLGTVAKGGDPWAMEVECSLAMGPAMEGDGADEYLFIHRVIRTLDPGQCP